MNPEFKELQKTSKVEDRNLEEEMRSSYLDYAMSVIVGRALPDVRDGLKPVHRRVLYTMHEGGLLPNRPFRKSARVVGDCMGGFHPHGDSAIYDTLVRMAQGFNLRYPLVDGQGNFGSIDSDPAAAMRYTEARLTAIATQMLRDIEENTVDFKENYDGSRMEPVVLPSRFPSLLVNGSAGIAVGMATNIPPHNLREVIAGAVAYLDNPNIEVGELMEHIPAPDFPTGGQIMGRSGIREAYQTGRGKLIIRAKTHIETLPSGKESIIVTEMPYQVSKGDGKNEGAGLIKKIAEMVNLKKIPEISDLRDESDQSGIRLVIELKRDAIAQVVLNRLYKHTPLQVSYGFNMVALVNGTPRTLGLLELIRYYIEHQQEVIVRRTLYRLKRAEDRAHILEGLLIALSDIDKVLELIRGSKEADSARSALMSHFGLSHVQAQAILDLRLQRLTALETDKIKEEHTELKETIKALRELLGDEQKIYQVIKEELLEISEKYGDERRSELIASEDDLEDEDLIPEQTMVVSLTNSGYIKALPLDTYRQQRRGGVGVSGMELKEGDYIEHLKICSSHDYLLFFTNYGRLYRLKTYQIPEAGRAGKGRALVNLLPLSAGEQIKALQATRDFREAEFLAFATRAGVIKKTPFKLYDTTIRSDGLIAIKLDDGDELISVKLVCNEDDIVLISKKGRAVRFPQATLRASGRDTRGVRGMKLSGGGDRVLSLNITREEQHLLLVTEQGYGKRTSVSQYPVRGRGGVGVKAIQLTEQKGEIVGGLALDPEQEVLFISEQGMVQRTAVSEIPSYGRTSQGVRLMNLKPDDQISALALVMEEDAGELEENFSEEGTIIATATEATEITEREAGSELSSQPARVDQDLED